MQRDGFKVPVQTPSREGHGRLDRPVWRLQGLVSMQGLIIASKLESIVEGNTRLAWLLRSSRLSIHRPTFCTNSKQVVVKRMSEQLTGIGRSLGQLLLPQHLTPADANVDAFRMAQQAAAHNRSNECCMQDGL